jgi:hypothetical protein
MSGSYSLAVIKNDIYAIALYNGDPKQQTIVPVPTEALEFFGLQRMKDTFSMGLPKIGDNKGSVLEERDGTFFVTRPELRNMMYGYLVLSQGPSI